MFDERRGRAGVGRLLQHRDRIARGDVVLVRNGDRIDLAVRGAESTVPALDYPTCDDVRRVGRTGMLHLHGRKEMYLSPALAGEYVGLREDTEIADRWLVLFANLALGHVEPGSHHFTALPVSTPTRLAPGEA